LETVRHLVTSWYPQTIAWNDRTGWRRIVGMIQRSMTWQDDFPTELWLAEVFCHIDATDVLSLSQVCLFARPDQIHTDTTC
jgi:hypothetical protein